MTQNGKENDYKRLTYFFSLRNLYLNDSEDCQSKTNQRHYYKKSKTTGNVTMQTAKTMPQLSKRQTEVASMLISGIDNKQIAERLFISVNTVKFHCKNIYRISNVKNRRELLYSTYIGMSASDAQNDAQIDESTYTSVAE